MSYQIVIILFCQDEIGIEADNLMVPSKT